jgi:hypothetical protein
MSSNWCNLNSHDAQGGELLLKIKYTCGMIAQGMRLREGVCPWGGGSY